MSAYELELRAPTLALRLLERWVAGYPRHKGLALSLCLAAGCGIGNGAPSAPVAPAIVTPYAQKGALAIRQVLPAAASVPRYGLLEFTVDLSATYDNPFDPADIALEARLRAPSGKTVAIPGFFYRPYRRELKNGSEVLTPTGEGSWRMRVTPVEVGAHTMVVRVRDRTGTVESQPVSFAATASTTPGLVRVSQQDRRYFAFEDGRPFFPIGANVCWGGGRGTFDYDDWFAGYAAVGANYSRLWLAPHWTTFALERAGKPEQGRGLGQFDLANAWRIDYVLDLGAKRGLWVKLCLDSFNILREKTSYPEWENSPHNAVHGGPLARPTAFWTNAVMDRFYENKLRYLVARYGAYPQVFAWEFWNEVDIITSYQTGPVCDWHQRMARTLRALDPWQHLITTSFANTPGDPEIDRLPELDYVQTHHYGSSDLVPTLAKAQAQKAAYSKPHYVGEIGADAGGPRDQDDPQGLQVHDPLWISVVTGGAGSAQSWWWDNLIHPRNLYGLFTPLVKFTAGVNWPAEGFKPLSPRLQWVAAPNPLPRRDLDHPPLLAWALGGKHLALAWVRVEGRTWRRVCAQKEKIAPAPPTRLVLPGLAAGPWRAELWDTWSGEIRETKTVTVAGDGEAVVALPEVERDMAVKLVRQ